MSMDWSNERYVRLYTRDTSTWKLLPWEARALLTFVLRKADRAGVIDVGDDGVTGLAAIVEMPEDVVEAHVPELVRRGCLAYNGSAYILPSFIAAQEAVASDRQRQQAARERRRAAALNAVTKRDTPSRNVTEPSRGVTRRHAASRGVTPSLAEPNRTETEREQTRSAVPAAPALSLVPFVPDDDPVSLLWREQERLRSEVISGCRALALTADRRKRIAALLRSGYSVDDLTACIKAYADGARRSQDGQWFNGDTNWRADNVARALGRISSGGSSSGRTGPQEYIP